MTEVEKKVEETIEDIKSIAEQVKRTKENAEKKGLDKDRKLVESLDEIDDSCKETVEYLKHRLENA